MAPAQYTLSQVLFTKRWGSVLTKKESLSWWKKRNAVSHLLSPISLLSFSLSFFLFPTSTPLEINFPLYPNPLSWGDVWHDLRWELSTISYVCSACSPESSLTYWGVLTLILISWLMKQKVSLQALWPSRFCAETLSVYSHSLKPKQTILLPQAFLLQLLFVLTLQICIPKV